MKGKTEDTNREFQIYMSKKIEKWKEIVGQFEQHQHISREDEQFLLNAIKLVIGKGRTDLFYSRIEKLAIEQFALEKELEILQFVVRAYLDSHAYSETLKLAVFGRKKVIDSCIEHANKTIQKTEKEVEFLLSLHKEEKTFDSEWDEIKKRHEILEHKSEIQRELLPKELDWLIRYGRFALESELSMGQIFFGNHPDKMKMKLKVTEYREVFVELHKAIQHVAHDPIPLLDTGQHLERMRNHYRTVKDAHSAFFAQYQEELHI